MFLSIFINRFPDMNWLIPVVLLAAKRINTINTAKSTTAEKNTTIKSK
jgi:hypothetical protein